jgi:hypothetical protein
MQYDANDDIITADTDLRYVVASLEKTSRAEVLVLTHRSNQPKVQPQKRQKSFH